MSNTAHHAITKIDQNRLSVRFSALRAAQQKALVTFIMAGDPDRAASQALLNALPNAGVDVVELGMPFTDPMADGPTIQDAGNRALAAGTTLAHVLEMAANFRAAHPETPLILMGYYNPMYRYGTARFAGDAAKAGVDGMIVVDVPPEEEDELAPLLAAEGVALIRLITPATDEARLARILPAARGMIYYVAVTGVTGGKSATLDDLAPAIARIRRHTDLPIVVGFGVKNAQNVRDIGEHADGVVVGSALIQQFNQAHLISKANALETTLHWVRELKG